MITYWYPAHYKVSRTAPLFFVLSLLVATAHPTEITPTTIAKRNALSTTIMMNPRGRDGRGGKTPSFDPHGTGVAGAGAGHGHGHGHDLNHRTQDDWWLPHKPKMVETSTPSSIDAAGRREELHDEPMEHQHQQKLHHGHRRHLNDAATGFDDGDLCNDEFSNKIQSGVYFKDFACEGSSSDLWEMTLTSDVRCLLYSQDPEMWVPETFFDEEKMQQSVDPNLDYCFRTRKVYKYDGPGLVTHRVDTLEIVHPPTAADNVLSVAVEFEDGQCTTDSEIEVCPAVCTGAEWNGDACNECGICPTTTFERANKVWLDCSNLHRGFRMSCSPSTSYLWFGLDWKGVGSYLGVVPDCTLGALVAGRCGIEAFCSDHNQLTDCHGDVGGDWGFTLAPEEDDGTELCLYGNGASENEPGEYDETRYDPSQGHICYRYSPERVTFSDGITSTASISNEIILTRPATGVFQAQQAVVLCNNETDPSPVWYDFSLDGEQYCVVWKECPITTKLNGQDCGECQNCPEDEDGPHQLRSCANIDAGLKLSCQGLFGFDSVDLAAYLLSADGNTDSGNGGGSGGGGDGTTGPPTTGKEEDESDEILPPATTGDSPTLSPTTAASNVPPASSTNTSGSMPQTPSFGFADVIITSALCLLSIVVVVGAE